MLPCVVESLTFPPVVPSSIGKGCACWFISCLTIVTVAAPDFVGSACAAAVTGTVAGLGTDEGAMYSPVEEIVPTVALPPVTPATLQVAAVLLVPVTVTLNCWVVLVATSALGGETLTDTGGGGGLELPPPQASSRDKQTGTARVCQAFRFTAVRLQFACAKFDAPGLSLVVKSL